jgi:flagellar basal-body rod protein FlgG
MFKALHTAASGMYAQQRNVEVVANNLANVNTTAFKRNDVAFADLLYVNVREQGAPTAGGSTLAGIQLGSGSTIVGTTKDMSPGAVYQTGGTWDFAIAGQGFFQVENQGGEPLYTRAGSFRVDSDGTLVTPSGRRLQNGPQGLTGATDVSVSRDGLVSGYVDGTRTTLGQIQIVTFPNPAGLSAEGDNLYRASDVSGTAAPSNPGQNGSGTLEQGYLERSNVDIAAELINLIIAQRAYETNSRAISTADQMMANANSVVR